MNPWAINPAWQNFSSLVREVTAASEAKTGMEKAHHLTASLYFGIAALEAFLNAKMRTFLASTKTENEIFNMLRKGHIMSKINDWPKKIIGESPDVNKETLDLITFFNEIRGDLTHPKTHGRDIYTKLETVAPATVIDSVTKYIVKYYEAERTRFPYWIFGWNYLNPRPDSHDIILINNQQFMFSLQTLGFRVPASAWADAESWQDRFMVTYDGYMQVKNALTSIDGCEPKIDRFPFRPILCRRWWTLEHHKSCGNVTENALNNALKIEDWLRNQKG